MKLLTNSIREQLLRNGRLQEERANAGEPDIDFVPVVKLFTPDASCTWLLTELYPDDTDIAFGLCDLGFGCPELGTVRISEIESVRGRYGLPAERDQHFHADKPISAYALEARARGHITA